MKKTALAILTLMFCWGASFAQYPNISEVKLNPEEILTRIKSTHRVPLYLWDLSGTEVGVLANNAANNTSLVKRYGRKYSAYGGQTNKQILKSAAKTALSAAITANKSSQTNKTKSDLYRAYYNAAVINFTEETFTKIGASPLDDNSADNVALYVTKALELSTRHEADLRLLRSLAWFRKYQLGDLGERSKENIQRWVSAHPETVGKILADFKEVEELDEQKAPYDEMIYLYEMLGEHRKAEACKNNQRAASVISKKLQMAQNLRAKSKDTQRNVERTVQKAFNRGNNNSGTCCPGCNCCRGRGCHNRNR